MWAMHSSSGVDDRKCLANSTRFCITCPTNVFYLSSSLVYFPCNGRRGSFNGYRARETNTIVLVKHSRVEISAVCRPGELARSMIQAYTFKIWDSAFLECLKRAPLSTTLMRIERTILGINVAGTWASDGLEILCVQCEQRYWKQVMKTTGLSE